MSFFSNTPTNQIARANGSNTIHLPPPGISATVRGTPDTRNLPGVKSLEFPSQHHTYALSAASASSSVPQGVILSATDAARAQALLIIQASSQGQAQPQVAHGAAAHPPHGAGSVAEVVPYCPLPGLPLPPVRLIPDQFYWACVKGCSHKFTDEPSLLMHLFSCPLAAHLAQSHGLKPRVIPFQPRTHSIGTTASRIDLAQVLMQPAQQLTRVRVVRAKRDAEVVRKGYVRFGGYERGLYEPYTLFCEEAARRGQMWGDVCVPI